ncbi:hypothetical protein SeMB42_g01559 [Synchytrium endobioticum]|uniref:Translation initiation factor 3 N-terminal domain-containing protein n=1 Tax=Synchytrium endobioticum TaxID=286115 RepID=A0A507DMW6_9FUNG|nr:hypothetical protein SeMB42_g01559 [Synchytrium endobioticum]
MPSGSRATASLCEPMSTLRRVYVWWHEHASIVRRAAQCHVASAASSQNARTVPNLAKPAASSRSRLFASSATGPVAGATPPSPPAILPRNEEIQCSSIQVIAVDGSRLGIMTPAEALKLYDRRSHDLVLVNPTATPPIARIRKKEEPTRQRSETTTNKEIEVRATISPHDLDIKMKRAKEFLSRGLRVDVTVVSVKGRGGFAAIIAAVQKSLKSTGVKIVGEQKAEGRTWKATFVPPTEKSSGPRTSES